MSGRGSDHPDAVRPCGRAVSGPVRDAEAEFTLAAGLQGEGGGVFGAVEGVGRRLDRFQGDGGAPVAGQGVAGEDVQVAAVLPDP